MFLNKMQQFLMEQVSDYVLSKSSPNGDEAILSDLKKLNLSSNSEVIPGKIETDYINIIIRDINPDRFEEKLKRAGYRIIHGQKKNENYLVNNNFAFDYKVRYPVNGEPYIILVAISNHKKTIEKETKEESKFYKSGKNEYLGPPKGLKLDWRND